MEKESEKAMITELKLAVTDRYGKSEITEQYFTSPLKLATPKQESGRLRIVLMMSSAGILKGDHFCYEISCGAGTKTMLTDQSYTKIFDTGMGSARKEQHIVLNGDASLYYCPCAVIPFQGSSFYGNTTVSLEKESEFAYSDIVTAGRVGMGERFLFSHFQNRICVKLDGKYVWMDHCRLEPEQMKLSELFFFDGYTHQGTFYYYGAQKKQEALLSHEPKLEGSQAYGVTQAREGICVRVLAHTAQDIEDIFNELARLLAL